MGLSQVFATLLSSHLRVIIANDYYKLLIKEEMQNLLLEKGGKGNIGVTCGADSVV